MYGVLRLYVGEQAERHVYVGMTDDLVKRVWQHRSDLIPGFTQRYGVKTLVWYEQHESRESAFIGNAR